MCLLVVCEPNSTPNADDLHTSACKNPHGFGFAIIAGDKIISERSMSASKSIARFLELREQYPDGYAMWHARYATHGVKNEYNCHPFKVGDSDLTYLAHNGILDVTIAKSDKRSDTRVFAEDTLPLIGGVSALDDDTVWTMVSKWASGSKICILTLDPSAKHNFYLINDSLGHWDDNGIWWSNSSYKATHTSTTHIPTTTAWSLDDDDDKAYQYALMEYRAEQDLDACPYCLTTVDLDDNPYFCGECKFCFDCGDIVEECLCYTPQVIGKSYSSWRSQYNYDF